MAKGVTIQLDVPRVVRFDGVAILRLEDLTGMNVFTICRQFQSDETEGKSEEEKNMDAATRFSFKLLAQVTQAGLASELPHANTEDIIRLMDDHGKGDSAFERVLSFTEKVFKALSEAIGDESKNVKSDPGTKKK